MRAHPPLRRLGVAGLLAGILSCAGEVESERAVVEGGASAPVREAAAESDRVPDAPRDAGAGAPEEALEADRVLAEQGDAAAQGRLADAYYNGRGVEQDYGEAARRARLAAEQGDARGQSVLGAAYYNGRGVEQDYGEALRWTRLAAEQGDARGQSLLAATYFNGHGVVEQDHGEAARWARLAAEQGDAGAQMLLGVSYLNGTGVEQDDVSAYMWLTLSASGGIQGAGALRGRLAERRMTPEQIAEAEARARDWEKK